MVVFIASDDAEAPATRVTPAQDNLMAAVQVAENNKQFTMDITLNVKCMNLATVTSQLLSNKHSMRVTQRETMLPDLMLQSICSPSVCIDFLCFPVSS